jgi:hypothetical protein
MWLALQYPILFLVLLGLALLLMIWFLPRLWRAGRRISRRVKSYFSGSGPEVPKSSTS